MSAAQINANPQTTAREPHIVFDSEQFRANYNREPFMFKHNLVGHPLLEISSLLKLAKRLPKKNVVWHSASIPVGTNLETAQKDHSNGMTLEQTIESIEEAGSWVIFKNYEDDPEYKALLDECVDDISQYAAPMDPGMNNRTGFLFISSPNAVTPYHLDREINYLWQIKGKKTVHLFDVFDRTIVSDEELGTFFAWHSLSKSKYKDEYQAKAKTFELTPGFGVHQPCSSPHWVQNGNEVSVSISTTYLSDWQRRFDFVHRANYGLRRAGITPRSYGKSPAMDSMKYHAFRAYNALRSLKS